MASQGLSLPGLVLMAGGLVLSYSGLNDPVGGPVGVVKDILTGKTPTPGAQKLTPAQAASTPVAGTVTGVADAVIRGTILTQARSYLGDRYVWGGTSHKGIDCSGLVLVAYRDGAGIKLPHLATAQAARGHRIDRSAVQPGDLVAWGVPGNYPHIALAVNADTVIVAPHTGTVVQYQKLWEKKVPGFGYPDIIRILKS
jgi:cell wall-associated NlpC family hydrolase